MQSHSREATGTVTPFDKYAESQSQSDCYPILLNMQRHSREAASYISVSTESMWIPTQNIKIVDKIAEFLHFMFLS